ncbi:transporter substrate-binding domain-containing protein [Pseudoduganella sp. LjRoot289]|uniref:hypothetical protein n=1 Tax=Pseudoduganella sp. LjRoot289 TaxID=3342314 RepID=UPI003ECF0C2A
MKPSLFQALPLLIAASLASMATVAAAPLTVSWREKPPYYYTEDGEEKGFMLAYGKAVFAAAGIDARFVREPQKRIWAKFRDGSPNYCSLAWYRLPERELVSQATLPVYADPPHTILVAPGSAARVRAHATLALMMADPELTLAVVDGVSYGPELDARIKTSANQIMRRTVTTTNMIQMLGAGRASYLLADRNDWTFMRARYKELAAVQQYDVPDLPPGLKRHILCSRDVPAATMEKLNQAIRNSPKPSMQDKSP